MDRLTELASQFSREPLVSLLNARLDGLKDGEAAVSAPASDEVLIVTGIVQGGIIAAVADYAGVYAAMTRVAAGHTPAMHIGIHFFRPVRKGETITARARVENENRSTIMTLVDVYGDDGKRKAHASILFARPKP